MSGSRDKKIRQMARRKLRSITGERIDIIGDAVKPRPSWMPRKAWSWLIRNLFTADIAMLVFHKSLSKEHEKKQTN